MPIQGNESRPAGRRRPVAPSSRPKSRWPPSVRRGALSSLAMLFNVHPTQIPQWQKQRLSGAAGLFQSVMSIASEPASTSSAKSSHPCTTTAPRCPF